MSPPKVAVITLSALLIAPISVALAEGGCPAGQYPHNTPGLNTCIPIPAASQRLPTGPKWKATWGAIAMDDDSGATGVTVGSKSERAAYKEALDRCRKKGATHCKVALTYTNQCASVARTTTVSRTGQWQVALSSGADEAASGQAAMKDCRAKANGGACELVYTDCSAPVLQK